MPDFEDFTDAEVFDYLRQHYSELDVGNPPNGFPESLIDLAADGDLSIEKRMDAFAVVCHANRQSPLSFVNIPPQSDLMFLFVSSKVRGTGLGRKLLDEVKAKYMQDQGMELVCAGEKRKLFFASAGFVFERTTEEGLNYMFCPPSSSY